MTKCTREHAKEMAEMAIIILSSNPITIKRKLNWDKLSKEIEKATLVKLVTNDEDILSEKEFQKCIELSTMK